MDEREDYMDLDFPTSRNWPWEALGIVVGVVLAIGLLLGGLAFVVRVFDD
jgi:hypothetical protein